MAPRPRRPLGERIDGFEIVRYLASGGMGDVYVARVVETGEQVALKFLADTSPANIERFQREGRIAESLRHPNIVAGRGRGRASDGSAYIAMELLDGGDLSDRLESIGVSAAEAVAIGMQVCDALDAAHARRIVHRDLKPQNIFLCAGESIRTKVLDFGIARLADDQRMTGTGMLVGTWSYMSPEQARAEPDIDARSDLWSLGVVLYECLASRPPFDAPTSAGTLYQILFDQPPPLAKLCPNLPTELTSLVHRALAKTRADRFGSAAAMRLALASIDVAALRERHRIVSLRPAAPSGTDETIEFDGTGDTAIADAAAASVENRLTSVVFLRGVRELAMLRDVARELQGRVITLAGESALAVFGTDRWNGDEPDRAVRLALAVAANVRGIGIATGRVVRGAVQVTGAAVDTAAALARGPGIVVDATTRGALRGRYTVHESENGTARVEAATKQGAKGVDAASFTTPFVGRDGELAMLVQSVEAVVSEPQPAGMIVLGAAGMGKTRLRHEALVEVANRWPEVTALVARCEAFRRDTPFAALIDGLGDTLDENVLRTFAAVAQSGGDPVAALDRARTAFESALRGLAANGPVVLGIDDAQWLDASSQSALRWLGENAPDLPLVVWLLARPEGRPLATSVLPTGSVVELKPLVRAASEKIVRALTGGVIEGVLERAGGHPLFLEELAQMYKARGPSATQSGALPPSIEGAHLAQLDQLAPGDREFLKRSAVFGRSAWVEAVVTLGGDEASFEATRKANLVVARPRPRFEGTREFGFRSGVLQEVAYGLFTEGQRARLHERAAEWLGARSGVGSDELARHWELAGDAARAAEAYTVAAEQTARVSDVATTLAHADRALALTQDPTLRWRALVAKDNALQLAGERAVQRATLDELGGLAAAMGAAQQAEVAWREAYLARTSGDRDGMLAAGRRAIELAAKANETRWEAVAHNELAMQLADDGAVDGARSHAQRAKELAEAIGNEWLIARALQTEAYVFDILGDHIAALDTYEIAARRYNSAGDRRREAIVLANIGVKLYVLGRVAEARSRLEGALDAAKRVGNARTVAVARHSLGLIERAEGKLAVALQSQDFAAREAARLGHVRLGAAVAVENVYLALAEGRPTAHVEGLVRTALQSAEATHSPDLLAEALAVTVRAASRVGLPVDHHLARIDQLLESAQLAAEHRVDLRSAIFEACGRTESSVALARTEIDRFASTYADEEDRRRAIESLFVRRMIPNELIASPA